MNGQVSPDNRAQALEVGQCYFEVLGWHTRDQATPRKILLPFETAVVVARYPWIQLVFKEMEKHLRSLGSYRPLRTTMWKLVTQILPKKGVQLRLLMPRSRRAALASYFLVL
ncbi:hypothetical protein ABBQ38_000756 [Trebouxia sp. C0009 RCD-2024]